VTSRDYITETHAILDALDVDAIDRIAERLRNLQGRLFILGVGGSAATASHAVNDFRKLCAIDAMTPTDNVAEVTARTNDNGWERSLDSFLQVSRINENDAVLVFSVGGGSPRVSHNISLAVLYAKACKATVLGIVGRDGGETARLADECVIVPPLYPKRITPHSEGVAGVILHAIVTGLQA
jgi:D-sedoheptulose 7-phosphate isomerase